MPFSHRSSSAVCYEPCQSRTGPLLSLSSSTNEILIQSIPPISFRITFCRRGRRPPVHVPSFKKLFKHWRHSLPRHFPFTYNIAHAICGFDSIRATELVTRSIQVMMESGCDEVTLEAEVTNKGALALYGRLGFIRAKRLFRYYLNGVDAFRLKLLFPRPDPLLSINSNESYDHPDHPQDVYSELHHNVQ